MPSLSEADTCRKFVVPALQAAGWDDDPHSIAEQRTITDGRIVPVGKGFVRKPPKRVDYLLRYTRDFALAVIEAKASYKSAADRLQQAKDYADMLGLKFAYATNGHEIIEFDYHTGKETTLSTYPAPDELWQRYRAATGVSNDDAATRLLTPFNHALGKGDRYYQQIAINRTVEEILKGRKRLLLTLATGTGKTAVASKTHDLCEDVRTQLAHKRLSLDEIAARFHHRLVSIHSFANGNGRHERLMTDLLPTENGAARFSRGKVH